MMKFHGFSKPAPSKGRSDWGPKIVQPNAALSLQDILMRFTRGEAVPVGMGNGVYHEGDDDLSQIQHADLVDKAVFVEKQKAIRQRFNDEQLELKAKRRKKFEEKEKARIEADVRAEMEARAKVAK